MSQCFIGKETQGKDECLSDAFFFSCPVFKLFLNGLFQYTLSILESKNLEDEEKDNPVEEWDSEMRAAEKGN